MLDTLNASDLKCMLHCHQTINCLQWLTWWQFDSRPDSSYSKDSRHIQLSWFWGWMECHVAVIISNVGWQTTNRQKFVDIYTLWPNQFNPLTWLYSATKFWGFVIFRRSTLLYTVCRPNIVKRAACPSTPGQEWKYTKSSIQCWQLTNSVYLTNLRKHPKN